MDAKAEEFVRAISTYDVGAVETLIGEISSDSVLAGHVARYRSYNGMTPLHHACRQIEKGWVDSVLVWAPEMVNAMTNIESKPAKWTPLQCACLVDVLPKANKKYRELEASVSDLVGRMSFPAVANTTHSASGHGGADVLRCSLPEHRHCSGLL